MTPKTTKSPSQQPAGHPDGHTKKLVNYRRVSTDEQKRYGFSLSSQTELNRRYIESIHTESLEADEHSTFEEDFTGTVPFEKRPIGARIWSMLTRRRADGIVVHVGSRLSRELPDALVFIRECLRSGIEVHVATIGQVTDPNDIRVVIEFWQATEERNDLVEKLSRGKVSKARAGKWPGVGVVQFGYRKVGTGKDTYLKRNESELKTVRRIFNWLDDERISLHEITRRLSGTPAPGRWSGGQNWHRSTLLRIATSTAYLGIFKYKNIAVNLPELAAIDREQFDRVQKRLKRNRELSKRHRTCDYLLSGFFKCACGASMVGESARRSKHGADKILYYVCARHNSLRHVDRAAIPDTCRRWRADRLEPVVWNWLVEIVTHHDKLSEASAEYKARQGRGVVDLSVEAANLADEIARCQKRIAQLARDIRDVDTETARNALKLELSELSRDTETKTTKRDELLRQIDQTPRPDGNADDLVLGLKRATRGDVPYQVKREIMDTLDVAARLEGQGVRITSPRLGASVWKPLD